MKRPAQRYSLAASSGSSVRTEMANALVTGLVRITVPASLRIELAGRLATGVSAKDVVLHLLADPRIRAGSGVGKVFEFTGPVIAQLSTDERATLTNMTAELGGFTGIVAPDQETVRFLRERRGIDFQLEEWMHSDPGASYAAIIQVDCSTLTPMVARPGDPGNGILVTELPERRRSTSPTAAHAQAASAKTSTRITRCFCGLWNGG